MLFTTLLTERNGATAVVTINRPEKMNALNADVLRELDICITGLIADDTIRAIVITGAGEKAFVAGADINQLSKLDVVSGKVFAEYGQNVFNTIEQSPKPVIAAINGFALGGGAELAWACHIRLCADNAKFGQPEVNLGTIPGYGGTQRLTRLINPGRALTYILTGDMIPAAEAHRLGLVSNVHPQAELLARALELAEKIASKPAPAIRLCLNAVRAAAESPLAAGLLFEAGQFALSCGTEDFREGTTAFLEKRKPEFRHQ